VDPQSENILVLEDAESAERVIFIFELCVAKKNHILPLPDFHQTSNRLLFVDINGKSKTKLGQIE
jgi:hypothetical protein